jgi:hypothetical protein
MLAKIVPFLMQRGWAGRIRGRAAWLADRGGAPDVGGGDGVPERGNETFRRDANVGASGMCWQKNDLFVGKKRSVSANSITSDDL